MFCLSIPIPALTWYFDPRLPAAVAAHPPHMRRRLFALALLLGLPVAAQSPGNTNLAMPVQHPITSDSAPGFEDAMMVARQVKLLNIERQKSIVSETGKILQLARELNADANSDESTMSPSERIRKAEEIQRLAKSVREKMTYAVAPIAAPYSPYSAVQP